MGPRDRPDGTPRPWGPPSRPRPRPPSSPRPAPASTAPRPSWPPRAPPPTASAGPSATSWSASSAGCMREKAELLRLESGLSARHASESADAAAAADEAAADALPASEDAAPDGPLVRLADAPDETAVAGTATPSLSPGVQRTDEVVPEVQGDAAAQAARIDGYLASKFSPLTGLGAVFVTESQAVGHGPALPGRHQRRRDQLRHLRPLAGIHNPFGMGPGINYASWADGHPRRGAEPRRPALPRRRPGDDRGHPRPLGAGQRRQRPDRPQQQLGAQRRAPTSPSSAATPRARCSPATPPPPRRPARRPWPAGARSRPSSTRRRSR